MSKTTSYQRFRRIEQPYTAIRPEGNVFHVFGYTPEHRLNGKEEMELIWDEHDLGQVATPKIARQAAADWRLDLVGLYPIN